jgi:hypothetical protein
VARYPVKDSLISLTKLVEGPSSHVTFRTKYDVNRINACAFRSVGGVQMQRDHIGCTEFFAPCQKQF